MSIAKELPKRKWVSPHSKDFMTVEEIMSETGEGRNWSGRFVRQMLDKGGWERRYKRINGRPVPAYGHE